MGGGPSAVEMDSVIQGDSSSSLTSSNSDDILITHPMANMNLSGAGGGGAANLVWTPTTNTPQKVAVVNESVGVGGGHKLMTTTNNTLANAAIAEAAAGIYIYLVINIWKEYIFSLK